jgi:hypothetical protein
MNKQILTIILLLLLFYLLFFTKSQNVEGLEQEELDLWNMFFNVFTFGKEGKSCLKKGEQYTFSVGKYELDIVEPLDKMFINLSDDNCVIKRDKLVDYGFPVRFLEQILELSPEITVDDMNDKINEIKQRGIPYGREDTSMKEKGNQYDRTTEPMSNKTSDHYYLKMVGSLCFLYCCLALGRESITREQLTDNLSEWVTSNYMLRMLFAVIPTKTIWGVYDIFSDNNDTVPNFNVFLNTKIRKSNVKVFLENDIYVVINIINMLEKNEIVKISKGKDIPKMLNDLVDSLFDHFGKNDIIVIDDVIQKEVQAARKYDNNMLRKSREKITEVNEEEEYERSRRKQISTLDFLIMDRFGKTNDQGPLDIGEEEMNELLWIDFLLKKYLIENGYSKDDFSKVLHDMKDKGALNHVIGKITPDENSDEWEYYRGLFLEEVDMGDETSDFNNETGDFNNETGDFNNETGDFNNETGDFNNETFSPENINPENEPCIPIVPSDSLGDSLNKYKQCECDHNVDTESTSPETNDCINGKYILMEKFSENEINCLNKISTGSEQVQWCLFECSMDGGMCDLNDQNCSEMCESRNNEYTRDKTCIPKPVRLGQEPDYEFCAQFRKQSECDNDTGMVCHWRGLEEIGNEVPESLDGLCVGNTGFYCNQFITKYECDVAERLHHDYGGGHLLCNWNPN